MSHLTWHIAPFPCVTACTGSLYSHDVLFACLNLIKPFRYNCLVLTYFIDRLMQLIRLYF